MKDIKIKTLIKQVEINCAIVVVEITLHGIKLIFAIMQFDNDPPEIHYPTAFCAVRTKQNLIDAKDLQVVDFEPKLKNEIELILFAAFRSEVANA